MKGSFERSNESSSAYIKGGKSLDQLSDYRLLKQKRDPWNYSQLI
jgi:hypothetical protein